MVVDEPPPPKYPHVGACTHVGGFFLGGGIINNHAYCIFNTKKKKHKNVLGAPVEVGLRN